MDEQLNICKNLLYLSTQAQGSKPVDTSIQPLKNNDRAFLEEAFQEAANESLRPGDYMSKTKAYIAQLKNNTLEHADLAELVEEVADLVCDINFALEFCKLGGLDVVKQYLIPITPSNDDEIAALFCGLLAVIAQNNSAAQELLIDQEPKNHFLSHCLGTISSNNASETYKVKCVGAISSMVRGYYPALKEFSQQQGVKLLKECFEKSQQKKEHKLIERIAFAVANIVISFEGDHGNHSVTKETKVVDLLQHIYNKLMEFQQLDSTKNSSALEYIQSKNNLMTLVIVNK